MNSFLSKYSHCFWGSSTEDLSEIISNDMIYVLLNFVCAFFSSISYGTRQRWMRRRCNAIGASLNISYSRISIIVSVCVSMSVLLLIMMTTTKFVHNHCVRILYWENETWYVSMSVVDIKSDITQTPALKIRHSLNGVECEFHCLIFVFCLHIMRPLQMCASPKNPPVCLTIVAFSCNSPNWCTVLVSLRMYALFSLQLTHTHMHIYCRHLQRSILLAQPFWWYFIDKSQF